jgi:hypothetical protein
MLSATSVDNYHEHKRSGKLGTQAQAVLDFLAQHPNQNYSRSELARALSISLASICGRVNELAEAGQATARPERKCAITGKTITPVRVRRHAAPGNQHPADPNHPH